MTAQKKYITSLLLIFSTFLESNNVSRSLALLTTEKFIVFINKRKKSDVSWQKNWSTKELENFISAQNIPHKPAFLIRKFIKQYTPLEIDIFLHEFLTSLKSDNRSNSTIKNYRSDIQQFSSFVKSAQIKKLFEPDNLRSFVHSQLDNGLKISTIKRKLSSISQFALWAEEEKIVQDASFWISDIKSLYTLPSRKFNKKLKPKTNIELENQKTASKEADFGKPTGLPICELDKLSNILSKNSNLSSNNVRGDVEIGGIEPPRRGLSSPQGKPAIPTSVINISQKRKQTKPKSINKQLEDFLINLKINGHSKSTIRNYKSDINQFFKYTKKNTTPPISEPDKLSNIVSKNNNWDPSAKSGYLPRTKSTKYIYQNNNLPSDNLSLENLVTEKQIIKFVISQKKSGLQISSIKRKVTSISQFALWAENRNALVGVSSWIHQLPNQLFKVKQQVRKMPSANYLGHLDNLNNQNNRPNHHSINQNKLDINRQNKQNKTKYKTTTQKFELKLKPNNLIHAHHNKIHPKKQGWSLPIPDFASNKSVSSNSNNFNQNHKHPFKKNKDNKNQANHKTNNTQENKNVYAGIKSSLQDFANQINTKRNQKFLPYLNLAMMILFIVGLGVLGYQQFITQAPTPFAYPSSPTRPNRELSFQGRLTDTAQNPITTATDMAFRLYDNTSGGTQLWSSGTCSVAPDQDGIFNVGLGDDCGSEITENVFTENVNVWLEVEIDSETLTPRQSIKTVAYALNSETVQGYPVSATGAATINTILVMDDGGQVLLGEVSPTLKATSGTFSIEAQALTIQTSSGSDGDIILDPDGLGEVLSTGYFSAPGATFSATYAGGTSLVLKGGPGGTGNIQEWQNSSGSVLSVVDENGNFGVGTSNPARELEVTGAGNVYTRITSLTGNDTSLELSDAGTQWSILNEGTSANELKFRNAGGTRLTILSGGNVGIGTTSPSYTLDIGDSDGYGLFLDINRTSHPTERAGIYTTGSGGSTPFTQYGDLVIKSRTNTGSGRNIIFQTGNAGGGSERVRITGSGNVGIGTTSPLFLLDVAGTTSVNSLNINDTYTFPTSDGSTDYILQTNGSGSVTWEDPSNITGAGLWANTLNVFHPKNELAGVVDLVLGGSSTASANIHLQSDGSAVFNEQGNDADFRVEASGQANALFVQGSSGNIGAGTNNPLSLLQVNSSSSTFGKNLRLFNTDNTTGAGPSILFHADTTTTQQMAKGGIAYARTTSYGRGDIHFLQNTDTAYGDANISDSVMVIENGGNVGIGTTGPNSLLEIQGNGVAGNLSISNSNTSILSGNELGRLSFRNYDSSINYSTFTGEVASIRAIAANDFIGANGASTDLYFYTNETAPADGDAIDGGDVKMVITSAGNIGINTTTPLFLLDVAGTASLNSLNINDAYTFPTSDGSTDYILQTNGSGSVTWEDPSNITGAGLWANTLNVFHPKNELASVVDLVLGGTSTASANIHLQANGQAYFAGNVGIGTDNPATPLDVIGTGTLTKILGQSGTDLIVASNDESFFMTIKDTSQKVFLNTSTDDARFILSPITSNKNAEFIFSEANSQQVGAAFYYDGANNSFKINLGSGGGDIVDLSGNTVVTIGRDNKRFGIGTQNADDIDSKFHVLGTSDETQQIIQAYSSQTTNLTEWQDSSGAVLSVVDASGNFGVGTTNPGANLEVKSTGTTNIYSNSGATNADAWFQAFGDNTNNRYLKMGYSGANNRAEIIVGEGTLGQNLLYFTDAGDVSLDIAFDGNVGIGTTSPGANLHVQTNNNGLNIIGGFKNLDGTQTGGNAVGIGFLNESNGTANWWKSAIVHERTGAYGIGTLHFLQNGTADNSQVALSGASMSITSNGNIGIGTTTPLFNLDVAGTASVNSLNINDAYTFPTSDGSTDYILQTDGAGSVTWEDPSNITGAGLWANTLNVFHPKNELASVVDLALGGTSTASAKFQVFGDSGRVKVDLGSDNIGLTIQAHPTQTNNLTEWQDSNEVVSASINKDGWINTPRIGVGIAPNLAYRSASYENNTGTSGEVINAYNYTLVQPTGNTSSTYTSLYNRTLLANNFDYTGDVQAIYALVDFRGSSIQNLYGSRTQIISNSAANSPTATNIFGSRITIDKSLFTTITNSYGQYIDNVSGATNNYAVYTNAGDVILNAGNDAGTNIGIGTTTPLFLLDVAGTASLNSLNINDAYTFPTSDGSTDYILQTDGSGSVTWEDPSNITGAGLWANTLNVFHPKNELASVVDLVLGGTSTTSANIHLLSDGSAVFNEQGNDSDFRVEASGQANALFVQGSDGNIGVGTSSPGAKLDIGGQEFNANYIRIKGYGGTGDEIAGLSFWNTVSSDYEIAKIVAGRGTTDVNDGFLSFQTKDGGTLTEQVRILENGNVGIGTDNPGSILELASTSNTQINIKGGSASLHPAIALIDEETGGTQWNIENGREGDGILGFYRAGTKMVINHNGNVGIGTTAPAELLHIVNTNSGANSVGAKLSNPGAGVGNAVSLDFQNFITNGQGSRIQSYRSNAGNFATDLAFYTNTGGTSTAITEKLRITDDGNIGIGTTTPSSFKLEVDGNVGPALDNTYSLGSASRRWANIYSSGNIIATGLWDADTDTGIQVEEASDEDIIRFDTAGSERMVIDAGGNVGIGTTGPRTTLDIVKANQDLTPNVSGATQVHLALRTNDDVAIDNGPAIGFGGTYITGSTTPILYASIAGRKTSATSGNADGYLSFHVWQTDGLKEKMRITHDGNIGIGTTTPLFLLDVAGTASLNSLNINDAYTFPTSDGSVDYILQTNGSGSVTWEDPSNITGAGLWANTLNVFHPKNELASVVDLVLGGTSTASANIHLQANGTALFKNSSNSTTAFQIQQSDSTSVFNVDTTNGRVGIGTSNPLGKLHVFSDPSALKTYTGLGEQTGLAIEGYALPSGSYTRYVDFVALGDTVYNRESIMRFLTKPSSGDIKEAMRINGDGNVGIGTTSPTSKLEIYGGVGANSQIAINSDSANNSQLILKSAGIIKSAVTYVGGDDSLQIFHGGSNRISIITDGNVGIGTTGPQSKFAVAGDNATTSFSIQNASGTMSVLDATTPSAVGTGGTIVFGSTYYTGGNTMATAAIGSYKEYAPSNGFDEYNHSLIFKTGRQSEGVLEKMRITSVGNIGIGTTTPSGLLDITGSATGQALVQLQEMGDQDILTASNSAGVSRFRIANTGYTYAERFLDISGPEYYLDPDSDTISMVVASNVGIGTTNPVSPLQIGKTLDSTGTEQKNIKLGISATYSTLAQNQYSVAGFYATTVDTSDIYTQTGAENQKNFFIGLASDAGYYNSNRFSIFQGGEERLTVGGYGNAGNIGIGTTTPTGKLEIYGAGQTTANLTDAGARGDMLMINTSGASGGNGGALVFGNSQSKTAGSLGWAAIKSYLTNGAGNTTGNLTFSTRNSHTDTALTERMTILANGNIGIGTTSPEAKLHTYESTTLGSTAGNSQILSRISGNSNSSNTVMQNQWLYRDAAGSNWITARIHDGISVDTSYLTPGTNTRVWWERDPYNNIQSWGDQANTYMTLNSTGLTLIDLTVSGNDLIFGNGSTISNATNTDLNINGDGNIYLRGNGSGSAFDIGAAAGGAIDTHFFFGANDDIYLSYGTSGVLHARSGSTQTLNLNSSGQLGLLGAIRTGSVTETAYNHFGSGGTVNYADSASDVYIQDELEVDGLSYFGDDVEITGSLDAQGGNHVISTPWHNFFNPVAGDYLILSTPIVHNVNNMFTLNITGYNYGGADSKQAINIQCVAYSYSGGFVSQECRTEGTDIPVYITTEIRADQGGAEVVVVYIGNTSSDFYYPQMTVSYSGWLSKDPDDFKWSTQSTPTPAGNYNNIYFAENSGNSFINSGNLGIGDTTPSYKLDVNGTGRFVGDLTVDGNDLIFGNGSTISNATDTSLNINGDGNIYMRGNGSGSFFDIGAAAGGADNTHFYYGATDDMYLSYGTSGVLHARSGAAETLNLDASGNLGILGAIRTGSITETAYNHFGSGGTVNYADSSSDVYIQDELEVDGLAYFGDNVGIGTTSPGASLHVATNITTGNLFKINYTSATTQTGDLVGLDLDLNTNVTGSSNADVTGINIQTPTLSAGGSTKTYYYGNKISAGALDTITDFTPIATDIYWYGNYIRMPDIDTGESVDSTTSYGFYIDGGTVTNGPGTENQYGLIVDSSAGNVGIGTTAPASKLDVVSDIASQYAGSFFNDGNNANRYGLQIQAGADSGAGNLIQFRDGNGTDVGEITFFGTTTTYGTSSDFRMKQNIRTTSMGLSDLMDIEIKDYEFKAEYEDDATYIGYIAQDLYEILPHAVYKPSDTNTMWSVDYGKVTPLIVKSIQEQQSQIALLITNTNPLNFDPAGNLTVVGKTTTTDLEVTQTASIFNLSIENLTIGGQSIASYITNIVNNIIATTPAPETASDLISPVVTETTTNTAIDIASASGSIVFRNSTDNTIAEISETGNLNLLGSLLAEEIHISGETSLGSLLVTTDATISGTITTNNLTAQNSVLGSLITNQATISGTLTTNNLLANTTSIGSLLTQDATVSGTLKTDTLITDQIEATSSRIALLEAGMAELEHVKATTAEIVTATISGTLYADSIYANSIYDFEETLLTALQQPSLLDIITGTNQSTTSATAMADLYDTINKSEYNATNSADLDLSFSEISMTSDDVTITGTALFIEKYFKVNGAGYISDSLAIGNSIFINNSLVVGDENSNTSLTSGVIAYTTQNPTNQILRIQPEGQGSIELLAGIVTIDSSGKVTVNGDFDVTGNAKIAGTLLTNQLKPTDFGNPLQVQVAGADTETNEIKKSRFEIINEVGTPVATFSAEGNAQFAGDVEIKGNIDIGGELKIDSQDLGSSDTNELTADKTSGKATILSGANEVKINSSLITNNTLIYVTAVGSTNNQVIYVKAQAEENTETPEQEGKFVVGFDNDTTADVSFNWWIVN